MNEKVFDAVFWTAFLTISSSCILKIISMLYKSKCNEIEICCIKVIRNIDAEVKEDIELMSHKSMGE